MSVVFLGPRTNNMLNNLFPPMEAGSTTRRRQEYSHIIPGTWQPETSY